jgi:hypothetical protein
MKGWWLMKRHWTGSCLAWLAIISLALFLVALVSFIIMPPVSDLSLWQEIQGGKDTEGMIETIDKMIDGK